MAGTTLSLALALFSEDPQTVLRSMAATESERKEKEKEIKKQNIIIQKKLFDKTPKHSKDATKKTKKEKYNIQPRHP